MDADIARSDFPSGATVLIGAEFFAWVHRVTCILVDSSSPIEPPFSYFTLFCRPTQVVVPPLEIMQLFVDLLMDKSIRSGIIEG